MSAMPTADELVELACATYDKENCTSHESADWACMEAAIRAVVPRLAPSLGPTLTGLAPWQLAAADPNRWHRRLDGDNMGWAGDERLLVYGFYRNWQKPTEDGDPGYEFGVYLVRGKWNEKTGVATFHLDPNPHEAEYGPVIIGGVSHWRAEPEKPE